MNDNKREHFRLTYPPDQMPKFKLDKKKHQVSDASEGGFSFICREVPSVIAGDLIEGVIDFGHRGKETVKGEVMRVDGKKVSVRFTSGGALSLQRMISEQRYLIQKMRSF